MSNSALGLYDPRNNDTKIPHLLQSSKTAMLDNRLLK